MEIYPYTSGVVETEQDFVSALHTFLTSDLSGWTRVEIVSDTSSDRDYAWSSDGENPDDNDTIYIRLRGYDNYLYNYGYITYTDSLTNTGELFDTNYTRINTNGYGFRYWIYGNADFVCYTIKNSNDSKAYTGYLGLIRSYYEPENDVLPLLVKGQYGSTYGWSSSNTCYMHNATTSGEDYFTAYTWWTTLQYDQGLRSDEALVIPVILVNTNAGDHEVRGEPYGVYQVNGDRVADFAPVLSASGVFVCAKVNNTNSTSYIYGPVSSGIDGFDVW
jgi:hypothetical protein